jgi:transposase
VAALDAEIAELEAAVAQEFAALGLRPADFPAGGPLALATLLAEAGDVRRFPSVKRFLAPFGWCPADTQRGASRDPHPRLARAGNRSVRRRIWRLAVHSVSRPGPPQDYFRRRTAAGTNKMDSLVAVGRKLLATTYAILKSGRPYDPAYRPACRTEVLAAA